MKPVKFESVVTHCGRSGSWMKQYFLLFSLLGHFASEHSDRMKDTIILPKRQIQKPCKPIYSHQKSYNLYFFILTQDNNMYSVCAVVNEVMQSIWVENCWLRLLSSLHLFSVFEWRIHSFKKYCYSSACWNWIMLFLHNFHWVVATYKEIQLNFPCRHRASFSMLL